MRETEGSQNLTPTIAMKNKCERNNIIYEKSTSTYNVKEEIRVRKS